jgi:hypothetical protein
MAKGKAKNEVATAGQFTQNDVPAMLEQVNEKISALTKASDREPSTKGKTLPGFGEIARIENCGDLIKAYSSVTGRRDAYDKAFKEMKIKTKKPPFTIDGVGADKWCEDIVNRYSEVAHKTQLDALRKIKKTLEENLSAEAKLANDLAKINGIMEDI